MKLFHNRRKEFETLTYPVSKDLYRLAYWRLANQQDAEDVVQEAYLRAFRSFHTFQSGTNIKRWMTRIVLNVINDALKKRIREADLIDVDGDFDQVLNLPDPASSSQNPEEQLIQKEIRPDLLAALQKLPTALLHPLLLRELEDMSYADIGAMLDIPVGTVMSRLFRARRVVRDRLSKSESKSESENGSTRLRGEIKDHEMQ